LFQMIEPPAHAFATPGDVSASADADGARALIQRQLARLERLSEIAMEMAEAVGRQARARAQGEPGDEPAGPAEADLGEAVRVFDRVARAVRLTVALQSRLVEALQALDQDRKRQARERRVEVKRIVGRVIDEAYDRQGVTWRSTRHVHERLDRDDIYDLLDRPVSEVIALICNDLNLSPDWPRLAREAWARTEMASGAVGSPLAALAGKADIRWPPPDAGPSRPHAASP
jgi:hypothetical protein